MKMWKTRRNYWSNSKFGEKLYSMVSIVKPRSATMEGWGNWKRDVQGSNPKLYWIVDKLLDDLQDVVYYPYDVYEMIRVYMRNRYIDKLHIIDTRLSKGDYHEISERMLNGLFSLLVEYVEVEKAGMGDSDGVIGGISYLLWEANLEEDWNRVQRETAIEVLELYDWWKNIRPSRIDVYILSGLEELSKAEGIDDIFSMEITEEHRECWRVQDRINMERFDEDTEMLNRLIKIRDNLWT